MRRRAVDAFRRQLAGNGWPPMQDG
jgi:hypothetical protein